jgi:hypothetical protein
MVVAGVGAEVVGGTGGDVIVGLVVLLPAFLFK